MRAAGHGSCFKLACVAAASPPRMVHGARASNLTEAEGNSTPSHAPRCQDAARMKLAILALAVLLPLAAAHSSLIRPKPRNAIDSELPEWKDGNAPYMWVKHMGKDGTPCACRNGTGVCASAQTCLWMSVGCSIGCKECDGGDKGPTNPNRHDRCGSGMKATNNDPATRTVNRAAEAGSAADWTKFNPWRAPGHAPVYGESLLPSGPSARAGLALARRGHPPAAARQSQRPRMPASIFF